MSDVNKNEDEKKEEQVEENIEQQAVLPVANNSSKLQAFKEKFMSKKYGKPVLITGVVIFLVVIIFSIFVCVNKFNVNVYKNVYFLGQDVSGLSSSQIIELLTSKNVQKELQIYQNTDSIYSVKSDDIEFQIDVTDTANRIMGFGRNENVFKDSLDILKAKFKKVEIEPTYKYNEEKVTELIKNVELSLKDRFVEDSYSVDEEHSKLIITKGKSGNALDYDLVKNKILECFKTDEPIYKVDLTSKKPECIEASEIYSKVKRDAKDAYIDKDANPIKFVKEEVGIDFSVDELKKKLSLKENQEEGKVIEFAIKKVEPKVKLQDITADMYNDKLAGYTTYFDASNYARGNNLSIALKYLNGKVVMPGEIFSYNDAIGDTTASKGYLPAAVFKGGTVENEIGGGICQTTSTLYNVVLMSNLEIVERHQHGLPVGYVPPSRDATVYIGVLDFRFKNTRNYPIKIVTSYSWNGTMNVSIYGTKEENEYDITLSNKVLSTIPYTTKYNYDSSMPNGERKVVRGGVNGYVSEGYITKSLNGKVVSSTLLSRDTYQPEQEIVTYGTGNTGS